MSMGLRHDEFQPSVIIYYIVIHFGFCWWKLKKLIMILIAVPWGNHRMLHTPHYLVWVCLIFVINYMVAIYFRKIMYSAVIWLFSLSFCPLVVTPRPFKSLWFMAYALLHLQLAIFTFIFVPLIRWDWSFESKRKWGASHCCPYLRRWGLLCTTHS